MSGLQITLRELDRLRAAKAQPDNIRTRAGLLKIVNNAGFAVFFAEMEVPVLWDAIAFEETMEAADLLFGGAAALAAQKKLFYGKVLRGRATLVALDIFPALLRSRWERAPSQAYLKEYKAGRFTATAKRVMDLLLKEGAMDTRALRRMLAPEGGKALRELDKTLNALQRDLYLCTAGNVEPDNGGWAASLFAPIDHWAPKDLLDEAFKMSQEQAMEKVILRFLDTAIISTPRDIARALRWEEQATSALLAEMVQRGKIASGVRVRRLPGEYLGPKKLLSPTRKK